MFLFVFVGQSYGDVPIFYALQHAYSYELPKHAAPRMERRESKSHSDSAQKDTDGLALADPRAAEERTSAKNP